MNPKKSNEVAKQIADAGIDLISEYPTDLLKRMRALAKIETHVKSSCGTHSVFMQANGIISDILINEEVRQKYEADEFANQLLRTIRLASEVVEQGVALAKRKQQTK